MSTPLSAPLSAPLSSPLSSPLPPLSSLQQLRDLIPFFICLEGDLVSAVDSLLRPGNGPASRFTPQLFLGYLRIFQSATAPKVTLGHPSHLWHYDKAWEPIQGLAGLALLKSKFKTKTIY